MKSLPEGKLRSLLPCLLRLLLGQVTDVSAGCFKNQVGQVFHPFVECFDLHFIASFLRTKMGGSLHQRRVGHVCRYMEGTGG